MPDYRSMFDRTHLGAWDLAGRDVTVTIAEVRAETISNGKQKNKRPVLKLRNTEKTFLCNKTNARAIAAMYGPNTDAWVGQRITLYPTTTDFGGQSVDAIRVRPTIPQARGTAVRSQPVDPEMRARQDAAAAAAAAVAEEEETPSAPQADDAEAEATDG